MSETIEKGQADSNLRKWPSNQADPTTFVSAIIYCISSLERFTMTVAQLIRNTVHDQTQAATVQVRFQGGVRESHLDRKMKLIEQPPASEQSLSLSVSSSVKHQKSRRHKKSTRIFGQRRRIRRRSFKISLIDAHGRTGLNVLSRSCFCLKKASVLILATTCAD